MIGRVRAALRGTCLDSPVRNLYRLMKATTLPIRNSLPRACRASVHGSNNVIRRPRNSLMRGVVIDISGNDNLILFHPDARLTNVRVAVVGSGNTITVGSASLSATGILLAGNSNTVDIADGCTCLAASMVCEDDASSIRLGLSTEIAGATELAAIEGTGITIGEGCLFSGGIHFRTGDSHSLVDLDGRRLNPSRNIAIGDHVWVGRNVTVLKGVSIGSSCVIGASAVVTKRFETHHCAIAGNPARVVREGVDWKTERIPFS